MTARPDLTSRHRIGVARPYRLDLTVSVLRRLSTNVVDLLTPDGRYLRALGGTRPVVVEARQSGPETLVVTIDGPASEHRAAVATARRMLGVDRDLRTFARSAARIPWLVPLVRRMRGVKPPRYPSLWETCVNAVVYQQLSVAAASAITRRFVMEFGTTVPHGDAGLYVFPSPQSVETANERRALATGISTGKLATLQHVAEEIASGRLDAAELEAFPSNEAAAALRRIKGIGPWTAALILLRGLGRLDVFPANDTGVARNLALVGSSGGARAALEILGPDQGMLYYCLLLARLEARGDLGRGSAVFR